MDMKKYRDANLKLTKQKIKESVGYDNFINQCVNNIDELDKVANNMSKRLREWYELTNPEFSRKTDDHRHLAYCIVEGKDTKTRDSMGADIKKSDMEPIVKLAKEIKSIYELRDQQENYLENIMNKYCPNVTYIAGSTIGARLVAHAGSLKKLSLLSAGTIQLFGAEKALFRHMKTGAKAPKHGLILNHPMLQKAKPQDRGKVARALSDKISIASKVDYFKGEFVADRLKKELEKRF